MIVEPEEGKTLNFIEQIIEEEIAAGKNGGKYIPVSRRSRMDIYISDMLLQYVSISGWLQNIMERVICVSMIPILLKRMWNLQMQFRRI